MNPASLMKLMNAKSGFEKRHPRAVAFVKQELLTDIPEGTILEVSITKPGNHTVTANLKVTEEDLEMLRNLRELS